MAIQEDISIIANRDVTLIFTITADEGQTLDDATIEWGLARHVGSSEFLVYKTVGAGITLPSEELTFEVDLTAEDTDGFDGIYYHEARVTTDDGDRITVTYGYATIAASLIRDPSE